MHELTSLYDPSVDPPGPALPPGHPFTTGATGVQAANYWSATSHADNPTLAWFVLFNGSGVNGLNKTNGSLRAWCVRGGMNADQY